MSSASSTQCIIDLVVAELSRKATRRACWSIWFPAGASLCSVQQCTSVREAMPRTNQLGAQNPRQFFSIWDGSRRCHVVSEVAQLVDEIVNWGEEFGVYIMIDWHAQGSGCPCCGSVNT